MLKHFAILLVGLLVTLSSCKKAEVPTLVIDGWWDVDYAKNGCESAFKQLKEDKTLIDNVGCNKVFRVQIWFQREKYDLKDKLSAKQIPLFYLQKKDGFKPSFLQHPCYFVLVSLMQFLKIKIRNCQNS